ncbi:MAG TPA: hypothetical protein VES19_02380 [Candidatus Limnocylindrales bacterium]|nr:hypothetical protein [Candidatus Limnocylindrales bacterium]
MRPYDPLPRSIAIAARTAHLLAMAGYLGTHLQARRAGRGRWRLATTLTGAALLATEASHSRHWPYQGRGLLALAHIGILPVGHLADRAGMPVAIAALVIGAVASHLPRSIRKWSLRHRRVVADEGSDPPAGRRGHAGTHAVGASPTDMLAIPRGEDPRERT